jgi:hypothetical protein
MMNHIYVVKSSSVKLRILVKNSGRISQRLALALVSAPKMASGARSSFGYGLDHIKALVTFGFTFVTPKSSS